MFLILNNSKIKFSNKNIIPKNKIVRTNVKEKTKNKKFPMLLFVVENLIASRLKPVNIPDVIIEKKIVIYVATSVNSPKISNPNIFVNNKLVKKPNKIDCIVFKPL